MKATGQSRSCIQVTVQLRIVLPSSPRRCFHVHCPKEEKKQIGSSQMSAVLGCIITLMVCVVDELVSSCAPDTLTTSSGSGITVNSFKRQYSLNSERPS